MNPAVKELWVTALRSDEFTQARGLLYSVPGTCKCCVLGVLAELWCRAHEVENSAGEKVKPVYQFARTLTPATLTWAGLTRKESGALMYSNDHGASFEELAKTIEETL